MGQGRGKAATSCPCEVVEGRAVEKYFLSDLVLLHTAESHNIHESHRTRVISRKKKKKLTEIN